MREQDASAKLVEMRAQGGIGLLLAALILLAWGGLHVLGVFLLAPARALPLGSLLLIGALTWLSVGLFIIAHDAMHGSLWPARRRAGNVIGALALALYAGFSYRRLLPRHHAHHRAPGSADDPDFAPASPSAALPWYWRFMRTYFGWREAGWMGLRVALYLALGAPLENILLFFALPALLSSVQLFYFGTFLPHRHLPHRHTASPAPLFADHHHARSTACGTLASLLSCFHFGYHHEHHLHPGAPWWQLPAVRRRRLQAPASARKMHHVEQGQA